MAQGRPTKWATAQIKEPIALGKTGMRIVIWEKWGKKRMGTAVILPFLGPHLTPSCGRI